MQKLLEKGSQKQLDNFCKKHQTTIFRIEQHMKFMEEHSLPIGNVSESATRPIRAQPKHIQKPIIEKVKEAIKKDKKVTTSQVKQWVEEETAGTCSLGQCSLDKTEIPKEVLEEPENFVVGPNPSKAKKIQFPLCCPKCPKFKECRESCNEV